VFLVLDPDLQVALIEFYQVAQIVPVALTGICRVVPVALTGICRVVPVVLTGICPAVLSLYLTMMFEFLFLFWSLL